MQQVKQLFKVFTNKILFLEWLVEINIYIGRKLLKIKAGMEIDEFAIVNENIDLRKASSLIKNNMLYDEAVLNTRWDLCLGCEFLTDSNKCEKCGCFMKVKHKLAQASCPVGKWGKYIEGESNGIRIIS